MKILITGGLGFQGSHLVERLLSLGHQITVLNTLSEESEKNGASFKDRVRLVLGSVTDKELVDKTVRDHELVFHLAARINVDESIRNPFDHISVNIVGTYNILEAVRKYNVRLIYISSCESYGGRDYPIIETEELRPQSPYAASKASADRLVYSYSVTYKIKSVIVRPFNIFGPRQKEGAGGAVIPIFIDKAMRGEPLIIFGDGKQGRDYLYIKDLIDAYSLIISNFDKLVGEVINLGTGKLTSIKSIAEYISSKFGNKIEYEKARSGEVSGFICDYSKAKKRLNWEPKVSILEGIDEMIKFKKESKK